MLAGAICALGCGGGGSPPAGGPPTLLIGAVLDQASASAFYSWPSAAKLAIDQVNEGLAQAGASFRAALMTSDTTQDASVATARSLELVRSHGAKAIIADTSRNGIAITKMMYDADATNDLDVPMVCVTCTAPNFNDPAAIGVDDIDTATLRDAQHWAFRTCNRGSEQTAVLERVILARGMGGDVNGDGKFKISAVVLDDNSGHGFVKSTLDLFSKANPQVIVEKIVLPGPAIDINNSGFWEGIAGRLIDDHSECIQDPATPTGCLTPAAGDGEPDALMENVTPGYNIALSRALSHLRNHVTFFHAHAFRAAQTADVLRSAIDGQEGVSAVLSADSPSGTQFATDVHAVLGRAPQVLDASVYDAVATLSLALVKATRAMADPTQVTGAQVRDALAQINDPAGETIGVGAAAYARAYQRVATGAAINYDGAAGPVDFDPEGNVWVDLSLYGDVDGALVDLRKFDCVHDHGCPAVVGVGP